MVVVTALLAQGYAAPTAKSDVLWPAAIAQLVPMPQAVTVSATTGGGVELKGGVAACLSGELFGGDDGRLARAVRREIAQHEAGGVVLALEPRLDPASAETLCVNEATARGMTPVFLVQQAAMEGFDQGENQAQLHGDEAYLLDTGGAHVVIAAFGEAGAFRGMQTLMQMCFHSDIDAEVGRKGSCRIPAVVIRDWPDLPNRGVMLDVSRNRVHTMKTFELLVDSLAALKFNQLQMYTEHTFAYSAHRAVWAQTGAITPHEALALSEYCYERFITLVPNQQSFGHMQHWLKHTEYRELAESTVGSRALWNFDYCCAMFSDSELLPYSLAPNNSSLSLLGGLYDELLTSFPHSRAVNIGMDETYDLGHDVSRKEVARIGKTTVYANFLNNISSILQHRGAHAMFWGDILFEHPHLFLKTLPKDSIVLDWGYEADAPFANRGTALKSHGVKSYVCPGTSSWLSLGGRVTNALRNVINAAQSGASFGAEGLLITDWGDGGHLQPPVVSFPAFVAAADFSWNARVQKSSPGWRGGGGLSPEKQLTMGGVMDRVAQNVDRIFLAQGAGGVVGKVLMVLGQVYSQVGRQTIPNRSALWDILMLANRKDTWVRKDVMIGRNIDKTSLTSAIQSLNSAQLLLDAAPSSAHAAAWAARAASWDSKLVYEELSWVLRILLVACQLGLLCVSHPAHGRSCNLASLPRKDTKDIVKELDLLIWKVRDMWLKRSRGGNGFEDSLLRLRHTSYVCCVSLCLLSIFISHPQSLFKSQALLTRACSYACRYSVSLSHFSQPISLYT